MGQFYESTAGRFVDDKMFQAPHQLMQAIIQNKDKAVDTEIASAVSLYDKLSADVLQQDNPRAKEVIGGYENKINDIVSQIQKNPLEYNKYSRDVRMMGRDIHKDWTLGEIGTMQTRKKELVDYHNSLDELHKKDPEKYDAQFITALKANALKDYKEGLQYNSSTGIGNKIAIDEASALPNLFEEFSKSADKMTADGYKIEKATTGNGYIYKVGNESKELTKEKLLEAFDSWSKGQDTYNSAIQQRKSLGLSGFQDADVNNIIKYGKDAKGNTIVTPSNNYYGRNASAIADTFFSKNTAHTEDINSDSTFMQREKQAHDDKPQEYPETTFNRVYSTDAGSLKTFRSALDVTNKALDNVKNEAGQSAQQVGIQPGSQAYKDIQNGNFQALAARGITSERINELTSQYRQNTARKTLLDAQSIEFANYAKKKGMKDADKIGTLGWSNNPNLVKGYGEFVEASGIKSQKDVPLTLTFNNMSMDKNLVKDFQDTFSQHADDLVFKVEGTSKGGEEVRETMDGNRIIYTSDKTKDKRVDHIDHKENGKVTRKIGVRYIYVPEGQLTLGRMVNDGVLTREINEKTVEDEKISYVGFSSGKKVGFTIDEKTLGLASGYDGSGKANLGASVIFGNNRGTLTLDASQLTSPTLKQAIQDRQEDFEFDSLDNKTNWNSVHEISKTIDGDVYSIKKGEAYMNGVKLGSSKEKRAVKMLLLGYYQKQ